VTEKREVRRKKKRIKLRFGLDRPKRMGFTEDLSSDGLFIITRSPERPGTYVLVELDLPNNKTVVAYGQVQWTKKVRPDQFRVTENGGMGVRLTGFETGEEDYQTLVNELRR
jgi:Tfp pilus assembly protein PilZ